MSSFYRVKHVSKFSELPIFLIFLILITSFFGFGILYSASGGSLYPWALRQMTYFFISMILAIFIALMDIKLLYRYSYLFYFLVLAMLILVDFFGYTAMGAKRWINLGIGGFRIQPSELIKIAIILLLARYFHNLNFYEIKKIRYLILPVILVSLPTILVLRQPDLGTGIIVILLALAMFLVCGVALWKFAVSGLLLLASLPIIWNSLHSYQKKRIMVFLNPELDPLGSGYNIIQSKIAIGSGGIFGKGLIQGTQSRLNFLPEHQTDFIFACLSEELGFVGGLILLILYLLIIYNSLIIAINSKNSFGKLLAVGVSSTFFLHVFINVGMVMGLLPVVGVPLPFISYGGTMITTMCIGFGLVMNVHVNRNVKLAKSHI